MAYTSGVLLLIVLCAAQTTAAFFRGQLRGPNICYNYDIGRHCCPGFIQRNGLCMLVKQSPPSTPAVPNGSGSRLRFAEKPEDQKIVNLMNVDELGRLVGIAHMNGRAEEYVLPPNEVEAQKRVEYNVPVDMDEIRRQLAAAKDETTTQAKPAVTKKPVLRFQPSPKPYRPWDVKSERLSGPYTQVAVGRSGSGYLQALMAGQQTVVHAGGQRWVEEENVDEQVAAFKGPDLVTLPLNGKVKKITPHTTAQPVDDTANRKYFKPQPIEVPRQQGQPLQVFPDANVENNAVVIEDCPEGYTSVYSIEDGQLCYPTAALMQDVDKAPSRGDAAFQCPPGHQPQSSIYGEACVPYGWRPCSDDVGCAHDQQQPLVNPVVVTSGCESAYGGESLPCKNTPSAQVGCDNGGCDQQVIYGPDNCEGVECGYPTSDCDSNVDGGCGDNPLNSDCNQGGCSEANVDCYGDLCDEVSAGSGRCLNGGTKLADGYCLCRDGFHGSQCEYMIQDFPTQIQDDVDECNEPGTGGRGPCSHQCLNTVGSYKCLCPAGSIVAPDGVSCMFITCPKCMHGGHCDTDTNKCVCPAGFTGDICETDVDECEIAGICSHECRNTFGSYACLCKAGYTLLRDGHSCEDWRCKPNCVNGGICVKNKCVCPPGFTGIICQFNNRL